MIERFVSGIAGIPGLTSSQANTPEAKLAAIAEVLLAEHHLHKEAKAENDSLNMSLTRIRAERDRSKGSPADCSRLRTERNQVRVECVEHQRANRDLKAVLEEKESKMQSLARQLRAVEEELKRVRSTAHEIDGLRTRMQEMEEENQRRARAFADLQGRLASILQQLSKHERDQVLGVKKRKRRAEVDTSGWFNSADDEVRTVTAHQSPGQSRRPQSESGFHRSKHKDASRGPRRD
ncbi:hypothetical protein BG003_005717 [Podila horticola]|nr:hypothetical protein BG003_005717 [Podila horticola]